MLRPSNAGRAAHPEWKSVGHTRPPHSARTCAGTHSARTSGAAPPDGSGALSRHRCPHRRQPRHDGRRRRQPHGRNSALCRRRRGLARAGRPLSPPRPRRPPSSQRIHPGRRPDLGHPAVHPNLPPRGLEESMVRPTQQNAVVDRGDLSRRPRRHVMNLAPHRGNFTTQHHAYAVARGDRLPLEPVEDALMGHERFDAAVAHGDPFDRGTARQVLCHGDRRAETAVDLSAPLPLGESGRIDWLGRCGGRAEISRPASLPLRRCRRRPGSPGRPRRPAGCRCRRRPPGRTAAPRSRPRRSR